MVVALLGGAIIAATCFQLLGSDRLMVAMMHAGAIASGDEFRIFQPRPYGDIAPLFLHVFLHVNWFHLIVNMAALLSFGPVVAKVFPRGWRRWAGFLGFFFICAAAGGLGELLLGLFMTEGQIAIGASSALSGLLPAVGWIQGGLAGARRLTLPWLAINLVFPFTNLLFPLKLAWAAHIGGLAAGFFLFPVIVLLMRGDRRV